MMCLYIYKPICEYKSICTHLYTNIYTHMCNIYACVSHTDTDLHMDI